MVKPQSRFKQSRASGTNSEAEFKSTLKTPSEFSKASPHPRMRSQLDSAKNNEEQKVDFYASHLISNETLLGIEETTQQVKSSQSLPKEIKKPKPRQPLYKSSLQHSDLNV